MLRQRGSRLRAGLALLAAIWLILAFAGTASALELDPKLSYTIDPRKQRVPSPLPYIFEKEINGIHLPTGAFKEPSDLFIDHEENLWLADTGNDRILKFSREGDYLMEISNLSKPEGVYVDPDGNIFVADTGNNRILRLDPNGGFVDEFFKPATTLVPIDHTFAPSKLVVDRSGRIYTLEAGSNLGIIVLDGEGNFRGFFGATRLDFSLRRLIVSMFATKDQRRKIFLPQPTPHSNLFLSEDGFLYTVVATAVKDQLQKLSPVGINVYPHSTSVAVYMRFFKEDSLKFYGERQGAGRRTQFPRFSDVNVNESGIITVVDANSAKVYQYDQDGEPLLAFGGRGVQQGQLGYPTSVVTDSEGSLFILDAIRNNIQVYRPTLFARLVHSASKFYWDGRYDEAGNLWQQVLKIDANMYLAHSALGKALYRQERYQDAMVEYFRGYDKEEYAKSYSEARYLWMRSNFGLFMLYVFLGIGAIIVIPRGTRRVFALGFQRGIIKRESTWYRIYRQAVGVLRDPMETFWAMREDSTWWTVWTLLALAIIVRMITLNVVSFHYSSIDPEDINFVLEVSRILVPFFVWVIANYGVSAIFYGEGSPKVVAASTAYCLQPYILIALPLALVSNVLTTDESALYGFAQTFMYWWMGVLIYMQVKVVHDFEFKQAAGVSFLNIMGMVAIFGISALSYFMTSRVIRFLWEVVYEVVTR